MNRCKPGQLAIINRSEFPENIGAIVEVLHEHVEATFASGSFAWIVRTNRAAKSRRGGEVVIKKAGDTGWVNDCNLTPIGDPEIYTLVDESIDKPIEEIA